MLKLTCGVPQGSIFGPILFLIYINDLPCFIGGQQIECIMYADDTTIISPDTNIDSVCRINSEAAARAKRWCIANGLVTNECGFIIELCRTNLGQKRLLHQRRCIRILAGINYNEECRHTFK